MTDEHDPLNDQLDEIEDELIEDAHFEPTTASNMTERMEQLAEEGSPRWERVRDKPARERKAAALSFSDWLRKRDEEGWH